MNDDIKESLIEQLDQYLRNTLNPEHGLSVKKLFDREVDYEVKDGKLVFSMNRHQPISCRYTKGLPMAAFIERKETYVFDPEDKSIQSCGTEFVRMEADYDDWAASQFEYSLPAVSRDGPRRFEYKPTWGETITVTSYRQAANLLKAEVLDWELRVLLIEIEDYMSSQEVDAVADKLKDACVKYGMRYLKKEWERMLAMDSCYKKTASVQNMKSKPEAETDKRKKEASPTKRKRIPGPTKKANKAKKTFATSIVPAAAQ